MLPLQTEAVEPPAGWRFSPAIFCLHIGTSPSQAPELTPLTFDPPAVYLTWQRDPSTTITVCWQTLNTVQRVTRIEVQKTTARVAPILRCQHTDAHSNRVTHRVQLENLEPATEYRFRFGPDSRSYSFAPMPTALSVLFASPRAAIQCTKSSGGKRPTGRP
jgi:hypothetical protein